MMQIMSYGPQDKMALLMSGNEAILQIVGCFGISLGFGDKTVQEVCKEHQVHCNTFLAVVNFVADGFSKIELSTANLSLLSLVDYLRQTHIYYLDYLLPNIRVKLEEAISSSQNKWANLIIKAFDEYTHEINKHMEYEDRTVFTYVESLLTGNIQTNYKINTYSKHHDLVSQRLSELKSIIIKYTPKDVDTYMLTSALLDIYGCEKGLEWHCKIEDYLFAPLVLNIENEKIKYEG